MSDMAEENAAQTAPLEPAAAWQPIETAPKDSMVWIWHPDTEDYSLAYFHSMRGRWVLKGDPNYDGPIYIHPTLWHPLPKPPDAAAGSGVATNTELSSANTTL